MDNVSKGDNVLLLWAGQPDPGELQAFVAEAKEASGTDVRVENLPMFEAREEHFEVIFVGEVTPSMTVSLEDWAKILKSLKPSGKIVATADDAAAVTKQLKLNGFADVTEAKALAEKKFQVVGKKPNFSVGASAQLKIGKGDSTAGSAQKKVWTLDNDDDDIVDEESLLAEEDKQKPNKDDLRCATTGKLPSEDSHQDDSIRLDHLLAVLGNKHAFVSNLREEEGLQELHMWSRRGTG